MFSGSLQSKEKSVRKVANKLRVLIAENLASSKKCVVKNQHILEKETQKKARKLAGRMAFEQRKAERKALRQQNSD